MEKRNINFQDIENKMIINYYMHFSLDEFMHEERETKNMNRELKLKQLSEMLSTVKQFVNEYPEMLNDEEIIKQEKQLESYIKANNLKYNCCYSYYDISKIKENDCNITKISGIRVNSTCYRLLQGRTKLIHLSNYYLINDQLKRINELSFRLCDNNQIVWNGLVERINNDAEFYYDSDVLSYLENIKCLKK